MQYDPKTVEAIRSASVPLSGNPADYDTLLDNIGKAQIVLLGEATHGTHEFYQARAEISKRLIIEKGFHAITIEGDWPDAYQVNRYIHGEGYTQAIAALNSFDRFPTWMWRNIPVLKHIEWLRSHNQDLPSEKQVGFYGLDLYSLYRSIDEIISCLKRVDPNAAAEAAHNYSCFEKFRRDPQMYAYAVFSRAIKSCEFEVMDQLKRTRERVWEDLEHNMLSADEAFYIEQNARVVKNAENYYRSLFGSETSTWNLRDSHMFETLNELIKQYQLKGIEKPKIIIWAHNSHIGNATATEMSNRGEYNIGQLVKEKFGENAFSVGFTTYDGFVSAAPDWHAAVQRKPIQKALPDSYEALFHATMIPNFYLPLKNAGMLPEMALERAIGVVYAPFTERASHYFHAKIREQFDAVIHYDRTIAVEPLEKTDRWLEGETPETYPSGL
jgi:erythromycin esterase-like protein